MTWLGICHASESVLPSGRAGLKAFPTQFVDSYTIVSTQRHVLCGGGEDCKYLDMSVGGGGGRVSQTFLPFLGSPDGKSVILEVPR